MSAIEQKNKRAGRALVCALTLGDFDAWFAASAIWATRLSISDRAALAFMALKALNKDDACRVARAAIDGEDW